MSGRGSSLTSVKARTMPARLPGGVGGGVGSRNAVQARQLHASRQVTGGAGTAVMGSRKLVGRGAAQMNSFHEMRREFEQRKAVAKGPGVVSNGRTGLQSNNRGTGSMMRGSSGSTRGSGSGVGVGRGYGNSGGTIGPVTRRPVR